MNITKLVYAKLETAGISNIDLQSVDKISRVIRHYNTQVQLNRMSASAAADRAFTDIMGNNYHPSKPQRYGSKQINTVSSVEVQS